MGLIDIFRGSGKVKYKAGLPDWANIARLRRQDIIDWWSPDWYRYEDNYEKYAGKIFTQEQKQLAKDALKFLLEFNVLPTIVNSATGREQVNRFRPALIGRDRGKVDEQVTQILLQEFGLEPPLDDPAIAQMLTESLRWIDQRCDAEGEISDAFLDAFVCSVGFFNTYWDSLEGIDGQIKTHEVQPWEVGFDPDSKARNFRDAMYLFAFRKTPIEEAQHLFPNSADVLLRASEVNRNHINPRRVGSSTDRPFYPAASNQFYDPATRLVLLSNYQVKTREDMWHYELDGVEAMVGLEEWNELREEWKAEGRPEPDHIRRAQWRYKGAWFAGDDILVSNRDSKEPEDQLVDNSVEDFTYGAITCYPMKSIRGTRYFSPVDLGKDPQIWMSKFLSLMVDIVGSGPKGAVITERRAFTSDEDRDEFRKEIARPDGNPQVESIEHVKFAPQPVYPSALLSGAEMASSGIWEAMGLNKLGAGMLDDPRRAPFATVNALQQANTSVFAMPFDSLRFARRNLGRRYLLFIRDYLRPTVILRAVGHDHAPAVLSMCEPRLDENGEQVGYLDRWDKEVFDRALEYDLVSDDAPTTPSQMIALFQVLTNTDMFGLLQSAGMAPPIEVFLDMMVAAGLPTSMKQDWLDQIQQAPDGNREAVLQELVASLPPELQDAIEAHFQAQSQEAAA